MTEFANKTRFAPSPTGLVHLGNARTALFSALLGDRFLLRIEDTDLERSHPEFTEALIQDLHWLGLVWDEGPHSSRPDPEWFQSARSDLYQRFYTRLEERGLAYPCFCSQTALELERKRQASAGKPPRYSGKCSRLTAQERQQKCQEGLPFTLRFKVEPGQSVDFEDAVRGPQHFATSDIGDFIIRRQDGTSAFFFSNAIDDALMGVTLVVRGEDHVSNTPRQLLLLKALDLKAPRYAHTALVLGEDGLPLSKRNGSRSLRELREAGYLPQAIVNALARLGHHFESEGFMTLMELKAGFRLSALGRSAARFDPAHLNHWQGFAVRALSDDALWAWLTELTQVLVPPAKQAGFLRLVRSNCLFPLEAEQWAERLFGEGEIEPWDPKDVVSGFFEAALSAHAQHPESYSAFLESLKQRTGAKGKALFHPLRQALTGRSDGPELALIYELLSAKRIIDRFSIVPAQSD